MPDASFSADPVFGVATRTVNALVEHMHLSRSGYDREIARDELVKILGRDCWFGNPSFQITLTDEERAICEQLAGPHGYIIYKVWRARQ